MLLPRMKGRSMRLFDLLFGRAQRSVKREKGSRATSTTLYVEQLEERTVLSSADNLTFVTKIYPDLLGRPAEQQALDGVSNALDRNLFSRFQEAKAIQGSGEYLNRLVSGF